MNNIKIVEISKSTETAYQEVRRFMYESAEWDCTMSDGRKHPVIFNYNNRVYYVLIVNDVVAGYANLEFRYHNEVAYITLATKPKFRSSGRYTYLFAEKIFREAFNKYKAEKIVSEVIACNKVSVGIHNKMFKLEAVIPKSRLVNSEYQDQNIYIMDKQMWIEHHGDNGFARYLNKKRSK